MSTVHTLKRQLANDPTFMLSLLDASVDGILAFDKKCCFTAWNHAMELLSGVERKDVIGKNAFKLFPFLKEIGEDKHFKSALAGKSVASRNRPFKIQQSGRQGYFEGHYSPLQDGAKIVGGIGVIRDITQERQNESVAREALQRLTFHVENSPLAVVEWDSDFRVSRWSESAERLFGWKAEEVLGKQVGDWQFVFSEDVAAVEQVVKRQREGIERHGVLHNRNYTRDGSVVHCEWYNSVLNDEEGALVSVLSLVLDVTGRKMAEDERSRLLVREREARKQAEDADRLKDEFLATLSHELRTPLTAVLGWASLIRSGEVPETEFHGAIQIIERNARSQARLIDDLLDVSRIITGNLHVDLKPMNLTSVVEIASDALRPAAQAKGVKLKLDSGPRNQIVRGDANRLRQVVWNLLLNGIKFTPRGGAVSVRVECDEEHARLVVSDTGEGISQEFLPYVFDRFRQAEGSISRRQGGLGLGLAVVRHLVELHGGSVRAESEGLGSGSTFKLELPLVSADGNVDLIKPRKGVRASTAASNDKRLKLSGMRILVVEDDEDSRALLVMMLKGQGAEVVSAASSAEALQAISSSVPHVLISDIGMPEEDGYDLISKVRALSADGGGEVVAIALTGYATGRDRERALASGYQLHLAKPVEPSQLVTAIAMLTGRDEAFGSEELH